jgi:uncharacterized protein (TIGR03086 family)
MHVLIESLLSSNRFAVTASVEVVSKVDKKDLGRPTPCLEWTLADLLAHMTAQHRGFAAAARGGRADPAVWRPRPSADPVAAYLAADLLLAAFADDGVADRAFALPELGTATFTAVQAVTFHLIDCVVHGWDVARAIDHPYDLHPEVVASALRIAAQVPNGPLHLEPGASFAPALPIGPGAAPLDRVLSAPGRDPNWRAA